MTLEHIAKVQYPRGKNKRYLLHLFDGFELNEENYIEAIDYDEAYRLALPIIGDYTEYQMGEL